MVVIPIKESEYAVAREFTYPDWGKLWSFKPSPETERWCRFFGFGRDEYKPSAYMMGGVLVAHPKVVEQLKKAGGA